MYLGHRMEQCFGFTDIQNRVRSTRNLRAANAAVAKAINNRYKRSATNMVTCVAKTTLPKRNEGTFKGQLVRDWFAALTADEKKAGNIQAI